MHFAYDIVHEKPNSNGCIYQKVNNDKTKQTTHTFFYLVHIGCCHSVFFDPGWGHNAGGAIDRHSNTANNCRTI